MNIKSAWLIMFYLCRALYSNILQPGIDNRLHPRLKCTLNRSRDRQLKLLRITFDNLKMFQRIEGVKPTYSRKSQLKDFAWHEKKIELRSYYPLFYKEPSPQPWDKLADSALENAARCPKPKVTFLETYDSL